MSAAIDWSVSLLPDLQRDLLEDLGVFATRFSLEAVESVGAGRSWDGQSMEASAPSSTHPSSRRPTSTADRTFSLLAIVREYALGRLEVRGEAVSMRNAHADYYTGFVPRVAPGLRGPGQADAVGSSGWSSRIFAPPSAISSTRTGSTTPATSPGASSSTGGSPGSSARCACGCSSCSTRTARSRSTPAAPRCSSRCGARCGGARRTGDRRGSARACGCSPRAATRMPRRWRSRRADRTRMQFPNLDVATAEAELREAAAPPRRSATGGARR